MTLPLDALRSYAASLPPETPLPVPAGTVLALLDAAHAGNGAPDRLLTAEQVAERLNLDVKTVYKQAAKWPFTKRLGPKRLRFSEHGLARHLARLPSPR